MLADRGRLSCVASGVLEHGNIIEGREEIRPRLPPHPTVQGTLRMAALHAAQRRGARAGVTPQLGDVQLASADIFQQPRRQSLDLKKRPRAPERGERHTPNAALSLASSIEKPHQRVSCCVMCAFLSPGKPLQGAEQEKTKKEDI